MMQGQWPSLGARFFADMQPASRAPENDGVEAPQFEDPDWIWSVAQLPDALDVARRSHRDARDRAAMAEHKAARLVQLSLTLLTLSLALSAFHVDLLLGKAWPWFFTLVPTLLGVAFLAISALEAHQVDRVGLYQIAEAEDLVGAENHDVPGILLAVEERGRRLAAWTANKKHSDVMQARAWFTRGLVGLVIAALVVVATRAAMIEQDDDVKSVEESTQTETTND